MKTKLYFVLLLPAIIFLNPGRVNSQSFDWSWLNAAGGTDTETANDMVTDDSGNVYITGTYASPVVDFDPGPGIFNLSITAGLFNGYILKMDPAGNFVWAKSIECTGGTGIILNRITIGLSGNIIIIGDFSGTVDADPGAGNSFLTSLNTYDIMILKLDPQGDFIWSNQIGGAGDESSNMLTVDGAENIYFGGYFTGTVDFDPGAGTFNLTSALTYPAFLERLDSSGTFAWALSMEGPLYQDIAIDAAANLYLTGSYTGTVDFNPGLGSFFSLSQGSNDVAIAKFDNGGNFLWAKTAGGLDDDKSNAITLDQAGNIFITGYFHAQIDIDPDTSVNNNITSDGGGDIFVLSTDNAGTLRWAKRMGGPQDDDAVSITVSNAGFVYTTGNFSDQADFDPGLDTFNLTTPINTSEVFISKLDTSGNFVLAEQGNTTPVQNYGQVITHDNLDNIFVCGSFSTIDLGFGTHVVVNNSSGGPLPLYDAFFGRISCINSSNVNIAACNSYTSPSGNYTWTTAGVYNDTVLNISGCDSIITINLTIGTVSSSSTVSITNCGPYQSPSGLYSWTISGTYADTIPNAVGCDSVMTINLTINDPSAFAYNDTACNSYTSPSGNYVWINSGIYNDTIPNAIGCDSVITVQLTLNHSFASLTDTGCTVYTSPSGLFTWTTSGVYEDTLLNALGCDSIITVHLTLQSTYASLTDTACFSYNSPSGNYVWTQSGVYIDTIPNSTGCDSIIAVTLTIDPIDTTISFISGYTMSSNDSGGFYQWLYCDSAYAPIIGEVNQTFTPTSSGSYAVAITNNGCTDTSVCVFVIIEGINEANEGKNFQVQPNPASQHITILSGNRYEITGIIISDVTGKIMYDVQVVDDQKITINVEELATGVYILQINSRDFVETKRLVISK